MSKIIALSLLPKNSLSSRIGVPAEHIPGLLACVSQVAPELLMRLQVENEIEFYIAKSNI